MVGLSVCLSVCVSITFMSLAQVEMSFGGLTRVGQRSRIRWGSRSLKGKGEILWVAQPIEKHWQSPLLCLLQKGITRSSITACSRRDHSIRLAGVTLNFPRREKSAPGDAAFCRNSLTACCYCVALSEPVVEFITVHVYTCGLNCWSQGAEFVEEFALVEYDRDGSLVDEALRGRDADHGCSAAQHRSSHST